MVVVWTFSSHLSFLTSFSLSLGDGLIWTGVLPQMAVKPSTASQPTQTLKVIDWRHFTFENATKKCSIEIKVGRSAYNAASAEKKTKNE